MYKNIFFLNEKYNIREEESNLKLLKSKIIFIYWAQKFVNAPDIVKKCLLSWKLSISRCCMFNTI